jgi:hypothetical protein
MSTDDVFARVRHLLAPFGFDVRLYTSIQYMAEFTASMTVSAAGHAMNGRRLSVLYTIRAEQLHRNDRADSLPERIAFEIMRQALTEVNKVPTTPRT